MKRNKITLDQPFDFEAGGRLMQPELVYHTSERDYRPGDKVVWICHALTGNSDPEDWWAQMVGKGCLIDPDQYYVVCVNIWCSPYGSSSPASIDPATGKPYMLSFPATTVRDITRANILVRRHLGIDKIDLLLGPSIGGFQAYEWAVMEPDVVQRAAFIATSPRVSPYLTAFCASQRMALLADGEFLEARDLQAAKKGLACARSIALISYRTMEGYNLTQAEVDDDTLFAQRAASYQRYQGKKLVDRFDAYCYSYLNDTLTSQNIGRNRGGVDAALSQITADSMVVCITSDVLFPPVEGREVAARIPHCQYREINSVFGHDGFLIENDQLVEILAPLMP